MYNLRVVTQFQTVLTFDFTGFGKALAHWRLYSSASTCTITTPAGEIKTFFNEKRGVK